ncbi:MAG: efflux RND transporter periplasmic adaptor subunit [Thermodesulfobacteriota bacterium]
MGKNERRSLSIFRFAVIMNLTSTLLLVLGCDRKQETASPPVVTVAKVTQMTVPIYLNYVGTTQSVRSVDIVARVEGFLWERHFVDGADVKEGDLLFVIDPRQYQASRDNARGQLSEDEAALAYAREQVERYRPLAEKQYITRDAFDQYVTKVKEAEAAVEADRAAVRLAELNLSYCKMYAPFDGRIGQRQVDVGNVVGSTQGFGQTTGLANIVQLDPIYVYFSPTERDLPEILRKRNEGDLLVTVILPDESIHPHQGRVDFIDNTVDSTTATITMRAVVPNPEKTLLPGQYAKVRVLLTTKPNAIVVPEQAVSEEQDGLSVLVVGKDNKVEERKVEVGTIYNGMRVIENGLKPDELVITEGLQKVKPGSLVQTKLVSSENSSKRPVASPSPSKEVSN